MDYDHIHDIARFTTAGSRHQFVGGKVDRMQHIAERVIAHRREKPEVTIDNPFELGGFVAA
jgi:hypothetical protein